MALWRGNLANVIRYFPTQAINFACKDFYKVYLCPYNPKKQPGMFFLANGVLSMISDNVFVATVYINEVRAVLDAGDISREHFDKLVIAINTGTNLPSVATPNGQAAFLFLLTSAIAPLIRLSYMRMVIMALPYTIVLTAVGLWGVVYMV